MDSLKAKGYEVGVRVLFFPGDKRKGLFCSYAGVVREDSDGIRYIVLDNGDKSFFTFSRE